MEPSKPAPSAVPFPEESVPWEDFRRGDHFGGRGRNLSAHAGPQPYQIGFCIEELPPGRQGCPAHWHVREEEHLYVLSGSLTVRIGQARHVMGPGDYVRFPAGEPVEHAIFNHTSEVCRYIIVGPRDPDEVCVYPDSNKVLVRSQGLLFNRDDARDYWEGEDRVTV